MNKHFIQNKDWHISDKQTGKYLGEVFCYEDETRIWIKTPMSIPSFLKTQIEFGFAYLNNDGYVVVPTHYYNQITEFREA